VSPPDPASLDPVKMERARERRKRAIADALKSARTWGHTPRERLRNAIVRVEHELLMMEGLDQALLSRLGHANNMARAKRDAALPVLKHESRARTFRRRRAQLALEVWK